MLPGAEKLSEIEEDQATPLGPPVARVQVPSGAASMLSMANINKLWKAMIAPNSDMEQRDGHWYGKPSEVVRPVRKEVLAQNKAIIEQIHPIIKNLPRKETANRRKVICEELAKLGDDEGRKLGAMKVIPADVFASRDSIPRRSCKDEGPTPQCDASELPEGAKILFFSQRWLTLTHPDDAEGTNAPPSSPRRAPTRKWRASSWTRSTFGLISRVSSRTISRSWSGRERLGLYITACDAFVSIDHPEYWSRAWCLVEQEFARCAGVKRYVISEGELAPTGP